MKKKGTASFYPWGEWRNPEAFLKAVPGALELTHDSASLSAEAGLLARRAGNSLGPD
jgi:hypothetical protein